MRLGYASVDVRDDPEGYTGATKPIWHAEVWWCKDGKAKMKEDDPEYPTNDHGKLECARIAIDAQTGGIVSIAGTYAPKQKKGQGIENTMAYQLGTMNVIRVVVQKRLTIRKEKYIMFM